MIIKRNLTNLSVIIHKIITRNCQYSSRVSYMYRQVPCVKHYTVHISTKYIPLPFTSFDTQSLQHEPNIQQYDDKYTGLVDGRLLRLVQWGEGKDGQRPSILFQCRKCNKGQCKTKYVQLSVVPNSHYLTRQISSNFTYFVYLARLSRLAGRAIYFFYICAIYLYFIIFLYLYIYTFIFIFSIYRIDKKLLMLSEVSRQRDGKWVDRRHSNKTDVTEYHQTCDTQACFCTSLHADRQAGTYAVCLSTELLQVGRTTSVHCVSKKRQWRSTL